MVEEAEGARDLASVARAIVETNLYMTLLDRVGVHEESIGDSTGKLELLGEVSQ